MLNVMNYSVALVGLITAIFLGVRYVRAYMKREGLTFDQYKAQVHDRLEPIADNLFVVLATAIVVSFVISFVSFRQLWSNDVFHVVVVASLLRTHVEYLVQKVF